MQYRPAIIYPFDSFKMEQDELLATGKITPDEYQANVALIPQRALAIKKWYVYYYFMHPLNGKYERYKVYEDINYYRGQDKINYAKQLRDAVDINLKGGYSPFDEEQKLEVWIEEREKQAAAAAAGDKSQFTMIQALALYMAAQIEKGLSSSSISAYTTTANYIRNYLNDNGMLLVPASKLTAAQYLDILKTSSVDPETKEVWENKTYNNYLLYTSTILNWLAKDINGKIIPVNPIIGAEQRKVLTRKHTAYSDAQLAQLLKLVREGNEAEMKAAKTLDKDAVILKGNDVYMEGIILTCYYALVRSKAEMREFKISNILFDRDLLRLDAEGTKGRKDDYIPLDPILKEFYLKHGFDKLPGDWYVFGNKKAPGPIQAAQNFYGNCFSPYKKALALGEEYSLYGFKHTRCIHLAIAKKSPYAIIQLSRHTTLEQLMTYLRELGCTINFEAVEDSRTI